MRTISAVPVAEPAEAVTTAESSGPPGDFAEIVQQHQRMVFSLALHFVRDPQAAEEIAQDVFLRLHQQLTTLTSADHVTFWLRKVTSHRCIDYSRRRRVAQLSLDSVPEIATDSSPGDPLMARRIRRLVASLPETARMIVILRYQEDLTPTEIASVLTMPLATVKSHLQRSLAMLREKVLRVIGDGRT